MGRRVAIMGAVTALWLVIATAAYAATCDYRRAYDLNANEYIQTVYSYTDSSEWLGDPGKSYSAERISECCGIVYLYDVTSGGYHFFDNGEYAPWRKSSFYNWYNNSNEGQVAQANNHGSCF